MINLSIDNLRPIIKIRQKQVGYICQPKGIES